MKIKRNDSCPCGSGKKYKKCCISKKFDWHITEEGNIVRSIPIDIPEFGEFLNDQKIEFNKIFGRDPGPNDPLFFQQYLTSIDQYQDEFIQIMREVGISEEYIYAYKATGRIVTEDNMDFLTDVEYQEWSNAVQEYFTLNSLDGSGQDSDESTINLLEELERCCFLVGMIVNQCGLIESLDEEGIHLTQRDYILYCLTKTLKTLKAIISQLVNMLPEDSLNLLRSIYENYLNIIFIIHKPTKIEDLVGAKIGLENGTHEYARNSKGQINKRVIYDKKTGKEYEGHISNYAMSKTSDYEIDVLIFDLFYDYLSSFTHPNISSLGHYVTDNKFDPFKEEILIEDIAIMCIFIVAFILDEIVNIELGEVISGDITTFLHRVKPKLVNYAIPEGHAMKIIKIYDLFKERSRMILERYSGSQ
ncbi:SEC-C domain-containing protein [Cohnella lubricantis]|uniref:SEC-C domain-containing protein n=1 Tax=Cohnella lubricantis TaxID=2163172 RepID=A0A841TFS1_9BACL|nr:SEC-C domain-containing protein [Cohnella lubricantis]MBB6677797.1 SEC-C domain-containing protein [Cohnella lubricantis]MBP2120486.1 hypothetical protein [Cohnella lubricantis]